ncbi:DUF4233 domain-containing protein [Micromonospora coxensis]|uniref:DUF4233 domain-containing protein n=1 Tax=Micromonospora coxensis TaxID=356852 RepID=A0A1C5HY40_9ACTN|nr:DUF4233 domain-containing protein [Micromonospora coxensis]SCG50912.1 Protein of unknown function [Micromonospora coxensis]
MTGPVEDGPGVGPANRDSAPQTGGPERTGDARTGPERTGDARTGPERVGDEGTGGEQPGRRRSGLRNPVKAVRGLGAGTLALEAVVLLLAIQPIRVVGGELGGGAVAVIVTLAVACVVLAGQMGRSWAWHGGTVLQGLLMLAGLLHWSLLVLGIIFALVWAYALHVRRVILG